ncbi:hypothetical protein CH373_05730 [Leptospira perolatii]|uniref:DUF4349 domain-containing protein n=1 Tax=Leptospira perolatii TaxID=2023191 RepID=A0A2M9ZQP6_9LEPT|nr:DUF4349 domain-containing protein [Leptospira perolatii]PJZ70564.1 hypothetical protein CH360_06150 [Leptospira perolatii]PJZ74400.1 hypothetical protein CH373_05730 [Leptospira perolatii]
MKYLSIFRPKFQIALAIVLVSLGFLAPLFNGALLSQDSASKDTSSKKEETIEATLIVKSVRPEQIRDKFLSYVKEKGGWLIRMSNQDVTVSVPVDIPLEDVLGVAAGDGLVIQRNIVRTNVGGEMTDLRAKIGAKRKHLEQLYKLLDESEFVQILEVETEINDTVDELEELQGELNYYSEMAANIRCNLSFRLIAPQQMTPKKPVEFPWMQIRNIESLLERF